MTNIAVYAGNQGANTINTGADYSPFIWKNCPIREIRDGTTLGWYIDSDFSDDAVVCATNQAETTFGNKYYVRTDDVATISIADAVGGAITLSAADDNEGCGIRSIARPFQIIRGNGSLWFEARIKSSTITDTKVGFFVGLAEAMTLSAILPIQASGVIADKNLVGFHRLEGDGDQLDAIYKSDGVTAVSNADVCPTALVADTYVKVGMYYNADSYVLTYYINGVSVATKTITAATAPTSTPDDFPVDVRMGLILATLNAAGSTPGTVTIEKWRCYQLGT